MMTLYRLYRYFALDGVITFFFLALTLYLICEPKNKRLSALAYSLLSTLSYFAIYSLLPLIFTGGKVGMPYWYYFLCSVAIALAWGLPILKTSAFTKLVYILFFVAMVQLYKYICSPLYIAESTMLPQLYAVLDITTSALLYALLFFLALFFSGHKLSASVEILPKRSLLLLVFPASLLGMSIVGFVPRLRELAVPILSAILLIDLPLVYYMVFRVITAYEEQRKMDAALSQSQAELAAYIEAKDLREELRRERHELKNRYFYIRTLLAEEKYAEADNYLESVIGHISDDLGTIETGNALLDYLLSRKLGEAKRLKIKVTTEIALPKEFGIDSEALCTVLANLLDNAIEASRTVQSPEIRVSMKCTGGYLAAKIANRVDKDVLSLNPNLETTKKDSENHGFGFRIIRKTVEKQNGLFSVSVENGYFVADLMLPAEQK